ncbi:hypothetical protein U9M48_038067 [Paspalum notatum var. saurae]|uniref:DC1 domain-containing protein n=1 Tax=Paspalum notatum var. saurae TaxID=547442 RepID=A0AAQ3UGA7_PASNO
MGASQSVSGHHSHREGWRHRLKRVGKNEVRAPCGICSRHAEMGEAVYRCRSCTFVVHDACYRLPKKINHLAHSDPLTLCDRSRAPAGARTSCSICAVAFDAAADGAGGPSYYFVYGCTRCHGFYAHPRCCRLPRTVHDIALHQHTLTLLAPPPPSRASGGGHGRSRRCVNAPGKCPNANRWQKNAAAWSYQCSMCNVELCLTCQMPGGGGPAVPPEEEHNGCGCVGNVVVGTVGAVAEELATAVGKVLHALCCATLLGGQAPAPTQLRTPASK